MPLYMESIMTIMRSMTVFDYQMFRTRLDAEAKLFQPNQKAMLSLRLNLLDSCLKDGTPTNCVSAHFKPGQLTIIEYVLPANMNTRAEGEHSLSSPFMDASSACSFFDIILGLFIESRQSAAAKIVGTSPPARMPSFALNVPVYSARRSAQSRFASVYHAETAS
jgi:hypothetical protein